MICKDCKQGQNCLQSVTLHLWLTLREGWRGRTDVNFALLYILFLQITLSLFAPRNDLHAVLYTSCNILHCMCINKFCYIYRTSCTFLSARLLCFWYKSLTAPSTAPAVNSIFQWDKIWMLYCTHTSCTIMHLFCTKCFFAVQAALWAALCLLFPVQKTFEKGYFYDAAVQL